MKTKRLISLLICAILTLSFTTAQAAFDISIFETEDYIISEDDMTGEAFIYPATWEEYGVFSGDDYVLVRPTIMRLSDGTTFLRLNFTQDGEEKGNLERVIIKIDNIRYFMDVTFERGDSASSFVEHGVLPLGNTGLKMIKSLRKAKEVKVRFEGAKRDIDFTLTETNISAIMEFYDDFIKSDASNKATSKMIEGMFPITEQNAK